MKSRDIVGIVGDVAAGFLLAAPGFTFRDIIQAKSVGERTCYPYLATMLNCLCWVAYGAPAKNLPVVIINGVGFLVEGVYCALYIAYSGGKRRLIAIILFISEFILAAIFAAVLLTLLRGSDKADVRQMIFGVFASASGVVMYASPIMDLVNVVKTKDKSNMSLALALFSFANGVVWTVYAFFKPLNWYIMIPNAVGIICASAQMVVYVLASFRMCCFKPAQ